MEVNPRSKQTEVGAIPEGWEVKRLGEVGDIRSGGTPSTGQPHFWDGDVPWCTPTDITALLGHKYLTTTARTISAAGLQSSSAEVIPAQSLIVTSRATIGECAINVVPMTTNQGFKNIVPFEQIDVEFLYYLMTTQKTGLVALCGGSTFLEIGKKQLGSYAIVIPKNRSEQRAIAAVLSDVDALLGELDRLIAKKHDLKQAAMQRLLTCQTRLPGFCGDWEVKSLNQLTFRTTGVWGQDAPDERNSRSAEIIRAGDISQDGKLTATAKRYVSTKEFERSRCKLDDLVITTSGNGLGKLWWCDGRSDVAASNFVRVLHPIAANAIGRFLYYALRTGEGLRQLQEHTATSAYPNLRPTYFSTRWIPVPPPHEQAAIAAVLSDMDAELAALESRRDKTRNLKQAMMQELLAGKTRLVPAGATDA